jgi:hypothetical protein
MWISSIGTLRYSPKLLGEYRKSSKYWLVIDCDQEIGRYFRHLYHIAAYKCDRMDRPAWESHITVIRDEPPPDTSLWEKYAGKEVTFQYSPMVESDGTHFWLPVECEESLNIRVEMGLPRDPEFPLHMTFGNQHRE